MFSGQIRTDPPALPPNAMPTPKLFKKFSSKGGAPKRGSTPDVTQSNREDDPQSVIVTCDNVVPAVSGSLGAAWAAAHQEPPQARGIEQLLNNVGGLAIHSSIRDSLPLPSVLATYLPFQC